VAGDVYDGADRSLGSQLKFHEGLKRLAAAGIRSFVIHGNHDPLDGRVSSLEWPEEVKVFDKKEVHLARHADRNEGLEGAVGGLLKLLRHLGGLGAYPLEGAIDMEVGRVDK